MLQSSDAMKQQRSFQIFWDDVIIGTTSFESGDPPMGVAYGSFLPNAAYRLEHLVEQDRLSARYAGKSIPAVSGVGIEDGFEEFGERQVTIFGVGYPLYEELFPEHRRAYDALYSRRRKFAGFLRRVLRQFHR